MQFDEKQYGYILFAYFKGIFQMLRGMTAPHDLTYPISILCIIFGWH